MAPKRQKTTHGGKETTTAATTTAEDDVSILNSEIFAPATLAAAREAYAAAEPYTHGVVTPLCDDARLRAVQLEMRENLTATFKETDLFKVLQTGDLVTIDQADPSIVPKIPELLRLRAAIYSPKFRAMVQEMTGCAPLTDRIDCSANVYPRSGHLLCHDDVIGTRCISYIIYLTVRSEGFFFLPFKKKELSPFFFLFFLVRVCALSDSMHHTRHKRDAVGRTLGVRTRTRVGAKRTGVRWSCTPWSHRAHPRWTRPSACYPRGTAWRGRGRGRGRGWGLMGPSLSISFHSHSTHTPRLYAAAFTRPSQVSPPPPQQLDMIV